MIAALILKHVLKTTRATIQLAATVVLGILAAVMLITTVRRVQKDDLLRGVAAAIVRGDYGDARRDLLELATPGSRDARVASLQGHLALRRVDDKEPQAGITKAIGHFKEALEYEPGRPSAAVGLAVAYLRLAEGAQGQDRQTQLEEANRALDQAAPGVLDKDLAADVRICRGALAFLKGDWKEARTHLEDVKNDGLPGRASVGSYYWHKGLLQLAERNPAAVDTLRAACLFNQSEDVARGLALALRVSCADPKPQGEGQDLAARAALARRLMTQAMAGQGRDTQMRYNLSPTERGAVHNAIGLGLYASGDLDGAQKAIKDAFSPTAKDGIFHMNRGEILFQLSEKIQDPKAPKPYNDAGYDFFAAAKKLAEDPARAALVHVLAVNSATCYSRAGAELVPTMEPLDWAFKSAGLPEKDYCRHAAVVNDRRKNFQRARELYEKAKQLGHPEAFKIEVRLEQLRKR